MPEYVPLADVCMRCAPEEPYLRTRHTLRGRSRVTDHFDNVKRLADEHLRDAAGRASCQILCCFPEVRHFVVCHSRRKEGNEEVVDAASVVGADKTDFMVVREIRPRIPTTQKIR